MLTGKENVYPMRSNNENDFSLIGLKQIRSDLKGPQFLIKPFLEKETVCVMFGESGVFKSFVALDLALSVAFGADYHGYSVHQGPVVYICGEGSGGIARRIEAWLIHRNLTAKEAPFYISSVPAELFSIGNAAAISEVIAECCADPNLIVIDTLSTNFGEGDESSNPDVATLMKNVNLAFREKFRSGVMIVHHVGHGANDRERGAYAIRANADSRILVKREEGYACSMHCKKMKDAPEFEPVAFNTRVVTIPDLYDSEGESVTSLVLEMTQYIERAADGSLTTGQRQALACLETMYSDASRNLQAAGRDPSKALIGVKDWLDRLQSQEIIGPSRSLRTKIKSQLMALGRIHIDGYHVKPLQSFEHE
ncbi:MAG: AAA family ATPase [Chromatiaceae bacterium]|nr:AAA family ATPase [Chromatiaceae bacterium]